MNKFNFKTEALDPSAFTLDTFFRTRQQNCVNFRSRSLYSIASKVSRTEARYDVYNEI